LADARSLAKAQDRYGAGGASRYREAQGGSSRRPRQSWPAGDPRRRGRNYSLAVVAAQYPCQDKGYQEESPRRVVTGCAIKLESVPKMDYG